MRSRYAFLLFALIQPAYSQWPIEAPPFIVDTVISGRHLQLPVRISAEPAANLVHIRLTTGLSEMQRDLVPILSAAINQDNRCGERLSVLSADLAADSPSTVLTSMVHVERWACVKAFGKEAVKRLVNGDATVRVRLTPQVADGRTVRFVAEVLSVDASGELGEILHSGSFGDALRDKIRTTLESTLEKALNVHRSLPPSLGALLTLRDAKLGEDDHALVFRLTADAAIPAADLAAMLEALKNYRGEPGEFH